MISQLAINDFRMAYDSIIKQGMQCSSENQKTNQLQTEGYGSCKYRLYGLKCFAGHIIPNEEYNKSMEGSTLSNIEWFKNRYSKEELVLLRCGQRAHDLSGLNFIVNFRKTCKRISEDYGFSLQDSKENQ